MLSTKSIKYHNIKLCAIHFFHRLPVSTHHVGNNKTSTESYKNIIAALVVVVVVDVVVVICCHFWSRWQQITTTTLPTTPRSRRLVPLLWLCTLTLPRWNRGDGRSTRIHTQQCKFRCTTLQRRKLPRWPCRTIGPQQP